MAADGIYTPPWGAAGDGVFRANADSSFRWLHHVVGTVTSSRGQEPFSVRRPPSSYPFRHPTGGNYGTPLTNCASASVERILNSIVGHTICMS